MSETPATSALLNQEETMVVQGSESTTSEPQTQPQSDSPNVDSDKNVPTVAKPSGSSGLTARVVLPHMQQQQHGAAGGAAGDSDVDESDEEAEDEGADSDFLANFPDDTEELELLHSRLKTVDNLRLARFAGHLKKLCLRQNLLSHLDPETFHQLTLLEELDLYDNKIKHLGDALDRLSNLSVLDLSFNLLKHVPERLDFLSSLRTIYFVQNKISKISNLASCTTLTSLELGGNRIRKIEGLHALVNLEELWLGKNKITKLEGLGTLTKLRILSLQSNRITKLENLENLVELRELYLSHNGVSRIENLEYNLNLTTIDLGSNFIPSIENLRHLTQLEELWINGNKIPDLLALERELGHIKTLTTLYLEANPCQSNEPTAYRRKIMLALPQLKQIDATYTRAAVA